jgi:protein phosphatase
LNSPARARDARSEAICMKLRVHGATDVGLVREQNEDAFLVDSARNFFAVADGLGGMPGGEVASAAAIASVREQLLRIRPADPVDLPTLFARAHAAVGQAGRSFGPMGIGTTLTVAHVSGGRAEVGHAGDSFALLVRRGQCRAITREHNVENDRGGERDLGGMSPNYRYALTRVVGMPEPLEPEIFEEPLRVGDRLVLATDGLTDMVEQSDIAALCDLSPEPADASRALVRAAIENGGRDNITVIVIAVDEI